MTFPIDITKTRLQLQGQADFTGSKLGFGGMAMNIAKTEGIGGLYAGLDLPASGEVKASAHQYTTVWGAGPGYYLRLICATFF